ncbi:MAG: RDD family protein [Gaiellaceae bacterium]
MEYAGFWRRFAAYVIDNILIYVVAFILGFILGAIGGDGGIVIAYVVAIVGTFGYFAWFESSESQATVGKMALGIQVTDLQGNRISFGRALGRTFAKILSALILYIGFIMAAFTEKKQGLHDMIAGTLVVKKGATMPSAAETPL